MSSEFDNHQIEEAKGFVQSLAPKAAYELGAYTSLKVALHLGVDAHGNRLTAREREIYHKTLDTYAKRINKMYDESEKPNPEGPVQHYHLEDRFV